LEIPAGASIVPEQESFVGFFDKHSWLLVFVVTLLLLTYTSGLALIWWGLAIDAHNNASTTITGIYLISIPTELVVLFSLTSGNRKLAFGKVGVKSHTTWLLLNEISRFITSLDVMLAVVGAIVPTLLFFSPVIKPGLITSNSVATLWAAMATLAFFAMIYGRCLMQGVGLRYETIGGASLTGAASSAGLASFKFRNELKSGLDYLTTSLNYLDSTLSSRGARLDSIDAAKLVVRSMMDNTDRIPYGTLRVFSDNLTKLPNLNDLPADIEEFLRDTRWPNEIRTSKRRVFGIEWIAITATVTAAIVGLIASLIQVSGQGPLTQTILSSSTAYFVSSSMVFFIVILVGLRSSGYSVQVRDIDAYEKDIVRRYKDSVGTRTSLRTIALIPEAIIATGSAALAFIAGFFLVVSAIVSIWYHGILSTFPAAVFIFAVVLFVMFLLLSYILLRDIRYSLRPKTNGGRFVS